MSGIGVAGLPCEIRCTRFIVVNNAYFFGYLFTGLRARAESAR
jgi:hypothetical protein